MPSPRHAFTARLRALARALPLGHPPSYVVRPPNHEITLYKGSFVLRQGRLRALLRGRVYFTWAPSPDVKFQGVATRTSPDLTLAGVVLSVPGAARNVRAYVWGHSIRKGRNFYRGDAAGSVILGSSRPCSALRYHVINFHNYWGARTRFGTRIGPLFSASRLQLGRSPWEIILDQSPDLDELRKRLERRGGFGVGHTGVITPNPRRSISLDAARALGEVLYFFLAFLNGTRCGPVIMQGLDRRQRVLWSEWGPWHLTSWQTSPSWLPVHNAADLAESFDAFHRRWYKGVWRDSLRYVIHWYVEANTGAGALEGSIILTQTALELLGWLELVETRRVLSRKAYDRLAGAAKVRALLSALSIPALVPDELTGVQRLIGRRGIADGPGAIAALRNATIHPDRTNRAFVSQINRYGRFQALQLALSYIELSLLAILGYNGHYLRRGVSGYYNQMVSLVPWVRSTPAAADASSRVAPPSTSTS